ncbi:metallopeptidase family protein [Ferrovibrio sp.]|uniref:metallopeptidase family protein n=1 Tax=Ferrovibrio sp. TaxID=1917215 RepID=UPI003D0B2235
MGSASHIGADRLPPSLDDLAALAEAERSRLMPALSRFLDGVPIRVEEFPDEDVQTTMGLESPFDLLGLYQGGSITAEEAGYTGTMPAMIFLYRRPLLDYWCENAEPLGRLVRHVLIHEIGHHFGLSDEDMERIENATD